jgi:hypothetical protein
MRPKSKLRLEMETLKTNGIPVFCKTQMQRTDAFNIARVLGIEIATRRRMGKDGFEIFRMK